MLNPYIVSVRFSFASNTTFGPLGRITGLPGRYETGRLFKRGEAPWRDAIWWKAFPESPTSADYSTTYSQDFDPSPLSCTIDGDRKLCNAELELRYWLSDFDSWAKCAKMDTTVSRTLLVVKKAIEAF